MICALDALGNFILYLIMVGRSGITPVLSMLCTLCDDGFCAAAGPEPDHSPALRPQRTARRLRRAGGELSDRFEPQHLHWLVRQSQCVISVVVS